MAPAALKAIDSVAQEPANLHDVAQRERQVVKPVSPWMDTDEAAEHLRFKGKHRLRSLYRFLAANGIPVNRRSARRLLIARADLDRAIRGRGGR